MARKIKGVVVEKNNRYCIVMTPEGSFEKVRLPHTDVQLGCEITAQPAAASAVLKPLLAAAVIILVIFLSRFVYSSFALQPVAYVSLDINPSIELALNTWNRVIEANGLNEDGERLLKEVDVLHRNLYESVKALVSKAAEDGYLKEGEENLIFTTVTEGPVVHNGDVKNSEGDDDSRNKIKNDYCKQVDSAVREAIRKINKKTSGATICAKVIVEKIEPGIRLAAKEKGLSAGKYLLYLKAKESGVSIDINELKGKKIAQLAKDKNIKIEKLVPGFTYKDEKIKKVQKVLQRADQRKNMIKMELRERTEGSNGPTKKLNEQPVDLNKEEKKSEKKKKAPKAPEGKEKKPDEPSAKSIKGYEKDGEQKQLEQKQLEQKQLEQKWLKYWFNNRLKEKDFIRRKLNEAWKKGSSRKPDKDVKVEINGKDVESPRIRW